MKSLKQTLIKEAIKRGYNSGVLIDYESTLKGSDTLGNGEFELLGNSLIKYESSNKKDIFRRYDTVYSYTKGWVKIVKNKHGISL